MPEFFNINPLLVAAQAILLTALLIVLIVRIFEHFVINRRVIRGISEIVLAGFAAIIIAAPEASLEVAQWLASTVGFG